MAGSKLGKFLILGALIGAAVSMFDRSTREQVTRKSKGFLSDVNFYSKNPDILKMKLEEKREKYQAVYEQLAGDANYVKGQVEELKTLTPQVKELVVNTKEAFVESKDEYKSLADDTSGQVKSVSKK